MPEFKLTWLPQGPGVCTSLFQEGSEPKRLPSKGENVSFLLVGEYETAATVSFMARLGSGLEDEHNWPTKSHSFSLSDFVSMDNSGSLVFFEAGVHIGPPWACPLYLPALHHEWLSSQDFIPATKTCHSGSHSRTGNTM